MDGKIVGIKTNTGISAMLFLALIVITLAAAPVYARDALFLGLTDKKGEPAHANTEQAIRFEFSMNGKFNLINETETQRFIREVERLGRNRTERFVPPSAKLADSAIIIRGIAEELTFDIKRSMLLWGKIEARMTIKLYFNEVSGPASYQGELSASASKKKDWLLFAKAKKTVHVSTADRSELLGKMQAEIVKDAVKTADMFFKSLATGPIHIKSIDRGTDHAVPVVIENTDDDSFPGVQELMEE